MKYVNITLCMIFMSRAETLLNKVQKEKKIERYKNSFKKFNFYFYF